MSDLKFRSYCTDCRIEALEAVEAENAALREDAERYRYLRDKVATETDEGTKIIQFSCDFDNYNNLDVAIDAAREGK